MNRYNPKDIEPKWQQRWADDRLYEVTEDPNKPKYVMLTEFPYPSGAGVHLGHAREYTYGDIMARHKRMQGFNVLYPMGYDAFGLPTENFAIKNKISPQQATEQNVAVFESQFKQLGYSIDWGRSFRTSDPDYYKWTQWLFLKFFEAGLAYQAEIAINWCPFEKTGLANEEVVNGRHERCDTLVEKRLLKQWMLKITAYADRLIDGLADLDYPSRIADQQIHWIGRSRGAEVDFVVDGSEDTITVFTTRPDTLFGAAFLVLAPEHPLVESITTDDQRAEVNNYIKATMAKSDVERQDTDRQKTGTFTGAYAVNPASGAKIPVWIADYVLNGYGTGAIMAVPAHDERDYAFATKFNLPFDAVVAPSFGEYQTKATDRPTIVILARDPKTDTYCVLNWHTANQHKDVGIELPGGGIDEGEDIVSAAKREFIEETGYQNFTIDTIIPAQVVSFYPKPEGYRRAARAIALATVHDLTVDGVVGFEEYEKGGYDVQWLTRQQIKDQTTGLWRQIADFALDSAHYSGEGVMVNSGKYNGLASAVAREQIVADLEASGQARSKTTYRLRDWIFSRQHYWGEPIPIVHCPEHGAVAVPADQLPVTLPVVDHYEPTDTGESPLAAITDWVNTTCPECGQPAKRETDTMPNWAGSSWYYLRYFDAHNDQQFVGDDALAYWKNVDMYLGGMEHTTLHLLYSRFWHEFFYDQGLVPTSEPYQARRGQGIILATDGTKMSKSKGNVINPTDVIESGYGADALRLAIAFLAPYDQTTPWSPEGVAGTYRFLQRVWSLVHGFAQNQTAESSSAERPAELDRVINKTIKKVSQDLRAMSFNTAIAALMECVNDFYKLKNSYELSNAGWREPLSQLVQLLAPYTPHISEELWQVLGNNESVHTGDWPQYDEAKLAASTVKIVVQVNGKVRAILELPAGQSEDQVFEAAQSDQNIQTHIADKPIRKQIFIKDKLLNLVV